MRSYLVSTTFGHNPGDEIIWAGIHNLLRHGLGVRANYLYYNRNPDLQCGEGRESIRNPKGNYYTDPVNLDGIDGVILAGSPEWFGGPMKALYKALEQRPDIPLYMLGIGLGVPAAYLEDYEIKLFKRAEVIVTRSHETTTFLKGYGIESTAQVCPALFSYTFGAWQADITETKPLIVAQRPGRDWHCIQEKYLNGLEVTDPVLTIHVKEHEHFKKLGHRTFYAAHAGAVDPVLRMFSSVISTRLHMAVAALSLGIPATIVGNKDFRIRTAAQMMSEIVNNVDSILDAKLLPARANKEAILNFKWDKWDEWLKLLQPKLR